MVAASCFTPQVVLESERRGIHLGEFPRGTESVALALDEKISLRGVFVPSDAGAPIVVHFLESGCSITQGVISFPSLEAIWELRDHGLASLVIDYRGVGSSDGKRSPDNLAEDARIAWEEALRRAGGNPGRIVLRGMSIGTLSAASLLGSGSRPAGAVLVSPVRGETVAIHYAGRRVPKPLDELIGLFYKEATDIDLMDVLGSNDTPLFVIRGEMDDLLPDAEWRFLRYAVRSSRGRYSLRASEDHIDTILEAHRLLPEEMEFYRELYPLLPPVESRVVRVLGGLDSSEIEALQCHADWGARLRAVASRWFMDQPELAAALAMAPPEPLARDRNRIAWLRRLPPERLEALPLDALVALADTTDDAGPLDLDELPAMERLIAEWRAVEQSGLTAEEIVSFALALDLQDEARLPLLQEGARSYVDLYEGEALFRRGSSGAPEGEVPPRLRLTRASAFRQAVRLLLKAACIPERVASREDDSGVLDVFDSGDWRVLALPMLPPTETETGEPEAQ